MRIPPIVIGVLVAVMSVVQSGIAAQPEAKLPRKKTEDRQPPQRKAAQGKEGLPGVLLVLVEDEHWVGEDTTFVLYDDGRLIYAPRENRAPNVVQLNRFPTLVSGGYASVSLTADELRELRRRLGPDPGFFDLRESYKLSDWSDEPAATIYAWRDGKRKRCYVYGDLRADQETRAKAPKAFLKLYDVIANFKHKRAKPWQPDEFQALLGLLEPPWTHDDNGQEWWGKDWPALKAAKTTDGGRNYVVRIPSKRFDHFKRLWDERGPNVKIDGKHYQVTYRFPLPQENLWFDER